MRDGLVDQHALLIADLDARRPALNCLLDLARVDAVALDEIRVVSVHVRQHGRLGLASCRRQLLQKPGGGDQQFRAGVDPTATHGWVLGVG